MSMPKNRVAVVTEIKRIFKKSGFVQDFRMGRFLSEDGKIQITSELANWYLGDGSHILIEARRPETGGLPGIV